MHESSIALHFDSLGEAYGFPGAGFHDNSFDKVADRLLSIANKFNFKFSKYVIGRDLENSYNSGRVREWAREGHEIGNHSYSHHTNLSCMSVTDIHHEVSKAHSLIELCTGQRPLGFVVPNWSLSKNLLNILIAMGYKYDASLFPSWVMYLMLLKVIANHISSAKVWRVLHRKDYFYHVFGSTNNFYSRGNLRGKALIRDAEPNGGIEMLPVPTAFA